MKAETDIALQFCMPKIKFTTGDIIHCQAFCYGISMSDQNHEIAIFNSKETYKRFLPQYKKTKQGTDAYDASRGKALFLVLSMEIVQTILPEDVETDRCYLGLNVKCIRLSPDSSLCRNSERIFFTLYHPMSCLDLSEKEIHIIKQIDLPVYWNEKYDPDDETEKPF